MALKPGDRIGIIGGGQLGRMLAMAAARLGFRISVLDPSPDAPAFEVSGQHIVASYSDQDALRNLAESCAVVTYEFENVDVDALRGLEQTRPCHPNSTALATSQDRLVEKRFFVGAGASTADFYEVSDEQSLTAALEKTGGSGILKTRRFGYDGKGQVRIRDNDETDLTEAVGLATGTPCILESLVAFEREVSIIAARATDGTFCAFDLAENVHRNGILSTSAVPARVSQQTVETATSIAGRVMSDLDYVGVLAIEIFVLGNGELLVNEFAPRVHNSGHWTEAACPVSQFEQHIRAVAGLPLGSTARHSDCIMENLIGNEVARFGELLRNPDTMIHLYGKAETRSGRKMGHVTRIYPKDSGATG